ncbi:MAG: hypothetical protein HRU40_10590 [Saprospiraceae bacterium]|nr:hypothetical protein [Saprospiraceae bacterium]
MNIKPALFTIILIATHLYLFGQEKYYTKSQIVHDLQHLKAELEQHHPGLYTYSSKATVDNWFNDEAYQLPDSISKTKAFKCITSFSSVLKDGHSYIYPSAEHLDKFYNEAPLFPLDVFLTNDSLIVIRNFSSGQSIPPGAILTEINGKTISAILDLVVQHTSRDGDNLAYPKHLFYQFFPAYYSFFFGFQDDYEITFLNQKKELETVKVKGIPRNQIKAERAEKAQKGIDYTILSNGYSMVLTIKSFDKKILKNDYNQHFKTEIKNIFKTIKDKQIKSLAIDLRDNQGGELSNGIYLLQHLMDSSFQCVHSYYHIKNKEKKMVNTKWNGFFQPTNKNAFTGKVYIFTNGGSFSCSSIVANTIKQAKRGQIIGEMTGGSAYTNMGAPNRIVILPNTKISFTIPKTQYNLREDLSTIGLGVVPDITIIDNHNKILHGQDNYISYFIKQ